MAKDIKRKMFAFNNQEKEKEKLFFLLQNPTHETPKSDIHRVEKVKKKTKFAGKLQHDYNIY
jgi:hypothetical protein